MIEVSSELSRKVSFIFIQSAAAAAAAAVLCVAILLLLQQQRCYFLLLLPAAVRHRVPDGKNCCWFIVSDPIVCLLSLRSNAINF